MSLCFGVYAVEAGVVPTGDNWHHVEELFTNSKWPFLAWLKSVYESRNPGKQLDCDDFVQLTYDDLDSLMGMIRRVHVTGVLPQLDDDGAEALVYSLDGVVHMVNAARQNLDAGRDVYASAGW